MKKTVNKECTRYYSNMQETRVAALVNGNTTANSGAGKFAKSDVLNKKASLSVECKTSMTNKDSFSIKKEWFVKSKEESFGNRVDNYCIAFNFGPDDKDDKYVITGRMMRMLVELLEEKSEE